MLYNINNMSSDEKYEIPESWIDTMDEKYSNDEKKMIDEFIASMHNKNDPKHMECVGLYSFIYSIVEEINRRNI